jgi:hypothetical protein
MSNPKAADIMSTSLGCACIIVHLFVFVKRIFPFFANLAKNMTVLSCKTKPGSHLQAAGKGRQYLFFIRSRQKQASHMIRV